MKKISLKLLALLSIASNGMLVATTSEFRTPLSLMRGQTWYPYTAIDDGRWVVDTWKGVYYRSASKAYIPRDKKDCTKSSDSSTSCDPAVISCGADCDSSSGSNTRHTEPLSALWFNKATFRGEEIFAGGMLSGSDQPSGYPALSFAKLAPRFDYNERGVVGGVNVHYKFGEERKWRVGARASIPFKVIEVERSPNCKLSEILEDVMKVGVEDIDAQGFFGLTYAYRLDFLSSLAVPAPTGNTPLVVYGTAQNPTTFAQVPAAGAVFAKRSNSGDLPTPPCHAAPNGQDELDANGSNGADEAVLAFANATDYNSDLGTNRDAQSKLYIIPQSTGGGALTADAQLVNTAVQATLNLLDFTNRDSAESFFAKHCILFCDRRITGFGDLDAEIYGGYHEEEWYGDAIFGIRFPTGKKVKNPGDLLLQVPGNNRHFEVKGGLEGGWSPRNWFSLRAYVSGSHVFSKTEKRTVPFAGATVRNIGQSYDVKVSYNYFQGNLDVQFYHPEYDRVGCSFGYELWARSRDKICCDSATSCPTTVSSCDSSCECLPPVAQVSGNKAKDLLEHEKEINCDNLRCGTNSMSHKLRGEVFFRPCEGYVELFGGGSHVIGGRYVMKETEAHIGIAVNF